MSLPTTPAFVLLLSVVMAAVTLLLAWRARRRLAGSTRAPGRIRRFTEKEFQTQPDDGAPDTDTQYFPEVEFALPDGTPVVFQSRFGDETEARLGAQVTVVYDASSPAATAEIAGLPAVVRAWRLVVVSAAVTLALIVGLCLASAASPSAPQTPAAAPTPTQILDAAVDLMQSARFCTFVTVDEDGQPRARIVDPFPPEKDMTVWMATKAATRKVAQIRKNPRATLLCFDGTKKGYATLLGTAAVVDDPAEKAKRWKPEWKDFYDDENRGKDYVLIRLKPTRLEVLSPAHGLGNDPRTWLPQALELK